MSTRNPQEAASQNVVSKVYTPVFFEKLANVYHLRPQSAEEAQLMLNMAAQLRMAHDTHERQKAASAVSPLIRAQQHLETELQRRGLGQKQAAYSADAVRKSANMASYNPALAADVLQMLQPV